MNKRSSAILSILMFVFAIAAQAVYIAYIGRNGEAFGYLETAIVQLYGSGR